MQASQIVAALRANSADAPRELFDAFGEQLIAYCWQLLRSEDATLIAVRDTMIVAQAHADRLRDPGLLGPWLLALARTECGRRRTLAAGKAGKVRNPVAAIAPALAGTGATAAAVSEDERPPVASWMRDEILTSIADPEQARYRVLAAARAPRLGSDGFPSAAAARVLRRSRKYGRRVRGGLLTAGVAAAAAMILVAAGVSLRGGEWPAAPAASASPDATAPGGGPALGNTAAPQVSHVTGAGLARQPLDPPAFGPSATGQDRQSLYDVGSQTGASGRASAARPGSVPPPPGLPPLMMPSGGAPTTSPAESPSATPWQGPGPSWPPSASPSPAGDQPSWWATRSPRPSWSPPPSAPPSPATGSPTPPQPQPTMQDASSSRGSGGDAGGGGPPPGGPSRRHWPNPSPGPDPGPTATFDSGGGQAPPDPGGAHGIRRGHGHDWHGRR